MNGFNIRIPKSKILKHRSSDIRHPTSIFHHSTSFATLFQKLWFNRLAKLTFATVLHFRLVLFISSVLFFGLEASAQKCNLILRGKILHQENDNAIEAAYVWILETRTGAASDQNGNFVIRDLCPGTYTLTIQYLGHKEIRQTINLSSNSTAQTFRMEEESMDLSGVEVHGHREAVQTTTAVTSLYGEALMESRGESLGESLKRVAGVTTFPQEIPVQNRSSMACTAIGS